MGFLDRLFGRRPADSYQPGYGQPGYGQPEYAQPYAPAQPGWGQGQQPYGQVQDAPSPSAAANDQAIRRYQYLLQTAPPEQIERAHEEAFAQLSPEQRRELLARLAQGNPLDRPRDDSPQSLARAATRSEMRHPGTLYRMFGPMGGGYGYRGGMGMGGMGMGLGSMLLASMATSFIATSIANEMFDHDGFMDWDTSHPGEQAFSEQGLSDAGFDGDASGGFTEDAQLDTDRIDSSGLDGAGAFGDTSYDAGGLGDGGGFDVFGGGFDSFDGGGFGDFGGDF